MLHHFNVAAGEGLNGLILYWVVSNKRIVFVITYIWKVTSNLCYQIIWKKCKYLKILTQEQYLSTSLCLGDLMTARCLKETKTPLLEKVRERENHWSQDKLQEENLVVQICKMCASGNLTNHTHTKTRRCGKRRYSVFSCTFQIQIPYIHIVLEISAG